jgi:hypothetical protein
MQQYQPKIDYAIGSMGLSAPIWVDYLNMVKEGAGAVAAVMGLVLVTGRVILMIRDWNKGKDDA